MAPKIVAGLLLGALLGWSAAGLAFAQTSPGDRAPPSSSSSPSQSQPSPASWQRRHEQEVQARLDQAESRLEIRASQQQAWKKFADAYKDLSAPPSNIPSSIGPAPDAVTIARLSASMATEAANRLDKLADATAQLESALSPNQKEVLNQMARMVAQRMMGTHMEMPMPMMSGWGRMRPHWWSQREEGEDCERHGAAAGWSGSGPHG